MARTFDPVTLRLFVAVCEERNIARAAAREALVASAVSKRIAAAEAAVGTPLLVRGRRGIAPTAAGEALLRQAREILGQLERLEAELSSFASGVQGSVRVMASVSALASALPYRRDHLVVAVHAGHPLARRRRVRLAETLDHEGVGVAPGGMMEVMLRRQAALLGRTPTYRLQVTSLDAACRIVAAGLGHAVLPREAVAAVASATGLVLLPLAEPWAERRFVIATRPAAALSATTRLLVQSLAEAAR